MEFNKKSDFVNYQSFEFARDQYKCFRAQTLTINGKPYCQIQKFKYVEHVGDYCPSKNTVCIPFTEWLNFQKDIAPKLQEPAQVQQSANQDSTKLTETCSAQTKQLKTNQGNFFLIS